MRCDTRHRSQYLYVLSQSLPSVRYLTLDKEGRFAEGPGFDTRQRRQVCRVLGIWHSANAPLPSPCRRVTFFRRASVSALGKVFVECPIENIRQRDVCRHCRCRVLFAECYTRQIFCRVFFGLCRVPVAHDKATVSGSGTNQFMQTAFFMRQQSKCHDI